MTPLKYARWQHRHLFLGHEDLLLSISSTMHQTNSYNDVVRRRVVQGSTPGIDMAQQASSRWFERIFYLHSSLNQEKGVTENTWRRVEQAADTLTSKRTSYGTAGSTSCNGGYWYLVCRCEAEKAIHGTPERLIETYFLVKSETSRKFGDLPRRDPFKRIYNVTFKHGAGENEILSSSLGRHTTGRSRPHEPMLNY